MRSCSQKVTRQRQCRIQKPVAISVSHIDDGFINCRFAMILSNQAPIVAKTVQRLLTNLLPTRVRR